VGVVFHMLNGAVSPKRVSRVLTPSIDSGGARDPLEQSGNDSKNVLAMMLWEARAREQDCKLFA
jgi:hypothetical protein